ncbi:MULTISPECIES: invasion associated locus B family protein [unclassified Mesorhizobium]|uniref:invasion associated locus B family protein n=1 Tax=unclassified Mesorhizobium TaxID=325217 RepID=UPI000FCC4D31|nr:MULTISPECIES: invasion associated locus B family protein [unclassified Mesorhizobium]RUW46956.1 invasion associated locus B family protein [Mesorhizobium sp. M8A.F.Ca.ET.021.01.1.1]TGS45039.1 invasion associated locus B family protein [Mesorhizobium sp. M8A.F.Ca.ET.182.01.1.1]TGS80738.1 invasion associated locus B family protein [Mesorhizobium sp. M8A.F.Ca.ET.181.01.1.1]
MAFLTGLALAGGLAPAAGQVASPYRIKPSEVVVPPDVKLGQYQRTIRPFENWTLICDENLKARKKVCNVSQVIEDGAGKMAFSWSLAATQDGKPYMILRTAPNARSDGLVSLKFDGRAEPIDVHLNGCNEMVCVGMLPVGPLMRQEIAQKATPAISYPTVDGQTITVTATLKGLSEALAPIK